MVYTSWVRFSLGRVHVRLSCGGVNVLDSSKTTQVRCDGAGGGLVSSPTNTKKRMLPGDAPIPNVMIFLTSAISLSV